MLADPRMPARRLHAPCHAARCSSIRQQAMTGVEHSVTLIQKLCQGSPCSRGSKMVHVAMQQGSEMVWLHVASAGH